MESLTESLFREAELMIILNPGSLRVITVSRKKILIGIYKEVIEENVTNCIVSFL